jgi:hypothetical protein
MTEKTYNDGIEDGYNYAIQRIFEALGINLEEDKEEKEQGDSEFLNKPK